MPALALVEMAGGGVVMDVPGATSARRSRCPALAQAVNRAVESNGLPAFRECGSFQHLRGRMFCGALAKCALADFGCDLFHWLPVCLRGNRVTRRARNGPRPPQTGICAHASGGVKKSAGTGWEPGLLLASRASRSTFERDGTIETYRARLSTPHADGTCRRVSRDGGSCCGGAERAR